jgi:hypothetical protein
VKLFWNPGDLCVISDIPDSAFQVHAFDNSPTIRAVRLAAQILPHPIWVFRQRGGALISSEMMASHPANFRLCLFFVRRDTLRA